MNTFRQSGGSVCSVAVRVLTSDCQKAAVNYGMPLSQQDPGGDERPEDSLKLRALRGNQAAGSKGWGAL